MLRYGTICQCRLHQQSQYPIAGNVFRIGTAAQQPTSLPASFIRLFSTSLVLETRKVRNKQRGVSPLRRTGPRQRSAVAKTRLPQPVLDPSKRGSVEVDEDHGLWGFFYNKTQSVLKPDQDYRHGRAWAMDELRRKDWNDLHSLWWACVKERNRIATSSAERGRLQAGFGRQEARERASTVRKTQQAIKQTLRERWYAWQDAVDLAETDPSINLEPNKENPAYNHEQDEYKAIREEQEQKIAEGQSQQYLQ